MGIPNKLMKNPPCVAIDDCDRDPVDTIITVKRHGMWRDHDQAILQVIDSAANETNTTTRGALDSQEGKQLVAILIGCSYS